jgi:imidazolonepropionase-like amidohydrolase
VTPGLIDCHSHTAIRGGVNEGSNNITAEVRVDDVIDPRDIDLYRELAGGLTAAHLLHGSANSIGGQDAVVKLHYASTRDRMMLPDAVPGIKFALGENPKQSNFRDNNRPVRYPATRMGVMESIRERFWPPGITKKLGRRTTSSPPKRRIGASHHAATCNWMPSSKFSTASV